MFSIPIENTQVAEHDWLAVRTLFFYELSLYLKCNCVSVAEAIRLIDSKQSFLNDFSSFRRFSEVSKLINFLIEYLVSKVFVIM